jgi:hypothetical protein
MVPIRAGLALLAASTAVAQPQPTVTLTPHWRAWPSNQSNLLLFNDSAEIWVDAQISPGIGAQVTYPAPPGSGVGTVLGLASIQFDLRACDVPQGTWTLTGPGFHGTTGTSFGIRSGWFGFEGTPELGRHVAGIEAAQFAFPPMVPNPTNPVAEIWRGRWSYQSFPPGAWLRFTAVPVSATVYVQYAVVNGQPQYIAAPALLDSGAPVDIFVDTGAPPPCYVFVNQVPDAAAPEGGAASFTVSYQQVPGNCGPVLFRWRKDCVQLNDGGNISGATTGTLTVSPVSAADAGRYDVLVAGVHSRTARLSVHCYANCDGSTAAPTLNVADFGCFLQRFAAGAAYANCDGSTTEPVLNVADFTCYLQRFAAGCP